MPATSPGCSRPVTRGPSPPEAPDRELVAAGGGAGVTPAPAGCAARPARPRVRRRRGAAARPQGRPASPRRWPCSARCCSSPRPRCAVRRCSAGRWATCSSSASPRRCSRWSSSSSTGMRRDLTLARALRRRARAHPARARQHRLVHRGGRAHAVAQERLARHPRHRRDHLGRAVRRRVRHRAALPRAGPVRCRPRACCARCRTAGRSSGSTYGLHIIAFPLWTFTLIAGAIWARQAWGSYWNWDPKEVWTFIIWVVYAAYLHARVTRGWRRQSATWVAVAGFVCIIVNYAVVNVYFVGQHSYSGL